MITFAILFLSLIFLAWIKTAKRRSINAPFPPGPPTYPIIGNLHLIPSEYQEDTFCEFAKQYGDIVHLKVPGRNVIVLNSLEVAQEILEKRSANYSDRPLFRIFKMVGWTPSLPFLPYGKQFQKHRQLLRGYLSRQGCKYYQVFQQEEARRLAKSLEATSNYKMAFMRYSAAVAISVAFGHKMSTNDDGYLDIITEVGNVQGHLGSPGSTLVEFLPFLKYMPSWFPGTYYVNYARKNRNKIRRLYDYPFEQVVNQMKDGTASPSFLSHHLQTLSEAGDDVESATVDVQGAAAVIYCAGSDTTASALLIILLSMVLYPECQRRAQQEIDAVVGSNRLPEFSDRISLPYVEAFLLESYRWRVVTPLAIPHCSLEDDIYNGMCIPKGSILIPNAKAMSLDENVYSEPGTFNPLRYFPAPEGNNETYPTAQFGFGRRKCPGRHLADATLWIALVTILASLDIRKAKDENGNEITPEGKMTSGIASHPKPFLCAIERRIPLPRDD